MNPLALMNSLGVWGGHCWPGLVNCLVKGFEFQAFISGCWVWNCAIHTLFRKSVNESWPHFYPANVLNTFPPIRHSYEYCKACQRPNLNSWCISDLALSYLVSNGDVIILSHCPTFHVFNREKVKHIKWSDRVSIETRQRGQRRWR